MARTRRVAAGAAAVTMVVGGGALFATPSSAGGVSALTGQCGIEDAKGGVSISSDGNLEVTQESSGNDRAARFVFLGTATGSTYGFTSYDYRYAVNDTEDFGPSSNELVRFGQARNDPGDGPYVQYTSPDNHNSNTVALDNQNMTTDYLVDANNFEIWVKAIFDVPNDPDPSCWTNAVRSK